MLRTRTEMSEVAGASRVEMFVTRSSLLEAGADQLSARNVPNTRSRVTQATKGLSSDCCRHYHPLLYDVTSLANCPDVRVTSTSSSCCVLV